ncbi:MAG: cytochrome c biogenesis protein CcdA [Spongiibacteraceae bacterium]|nr:cytochrome c biogenesis protein CcdA [Spongiibacteraceae bacterium]
MNPLVNNVGEVGRESTTGNTGDSTLPSRGRLLTWVLKQQGFLLILSLLAALMISASWLVFPYLVQGQKLLIEVGGGVKGEVRANAISLGRFLSRGTPGPGEAEVEVLYATPTYFKKTGKIRVVSEYRPDRYLIFVITETTHIDRLPAELPQATLTVDGVEYRPVDVEGPINVQHHRAVTLRFDAYDKKGEAILNGEVQTLQLELISSWDEARTARRVEWQLPVEYPEKLLNPQRWTPLMVLGLSAGLLSFVLTPCLLQLLVIYIVTVTGLSAADVSRKDTVLPAVASRKMFRVAMAFVLGFSLLFTATGAAIGYAGKEMQIFFAVWSPTISVMAGFLVVALGLWIGVRSRAPLVCRLIKIPSKAGTIDSKGYISSALMAVGFSLGCLTCFGGAIVATLLVYVGSLGSATVGAAVMFAFSLGIVVPFLLAALFLSRVMPLMSRLAQFSPYIGFVSMVVIIAFGFVLLTDNFHVLSDFIYPYLKLA